MSTIPRYQAAGQGHVFAFYDALSPQEQAALVSQADSIDVSSINSIHAQAVHAASNTSAKDTIAPLPKDALASVSANSDSAKQYWQVGIDAIAKGLVAVILMAGGQGTRLGSSAPKGCYDIDLPSHKSLFQIQAERIAKLQKLANATITWFVMTSGPTRKDTQEYFEKSGYFGLDSKDVIFFEQGVLPCLTNDGKILLGSKSSIAVAPDGNGGIYAALRSPISPNSQQTVLSILAERNIKYLHAYCVDNCLTKVCDPVFLGYCISEEADCAAKVVTKHNPTESVGVVALRNEKFSVVEYSELSQELAEQKDGEGKLVYSAGNIANHFYTTDFLNSVQSFSSEMAYHIASKKIPHVNINTGNLEKPTKPNGMKLELFVFDVFPFTKKMRVMEVAREDEFSPLKNAPGTGSDDPQTSRRDLLAQMKRWLEAAGASVADGVEVEVSPLVTYGGEGLEQVKGRKFGKSGKVESLEELLQLAD